MSPTPANGASLAPFITRQRFCLWLVSALGAFAFLLVLNGCTSTQVWMGSRVRLEKIVLTPPIMASLPRGPGIAPGEKSPLIVVFTTAAGEVLTTEGEGRGKVLWEDLKVTSTIVSTNSRGIVSLSRDPRLSEGNLPHLIITVPSHPELSTEFDVPVRYDCAFNAYFSGSAGSNGAEGSNGTDGANGSNGSTDPNKPSPGGNGSNGSNGSDGQSGEPGRDAPPVQVRVAFKPGDRPLLQVSVSDSHHEELFLIDPKGGTLTVSAEGGPGGSGGKGGKGGLGGTGGKGLPNGKNGRNGTNGTDGWDGAKGRGGYITVVYDPRAGPFLDAIHLYNNHGPPPVYSEESVAPLW